MLFYRTDIFDELNISVPETWDEFMKIIPVLQSKNMDIVLFVWHFVDLSELDAHFSRRI